MRRTRIYLDQPLATGTRVVLDRAAREHLVTVLRQRDGALVNCFNGDGIERSARLSLSGNDAALLIDAAHALANESALDLCLLQAIARGEKMDLILQKATELGVSRIVPLVTERTEVRMDAERSARRMAHWGRVVISAAEQCGRARLPQLCAPVALAGLGAALAGVSLRLVLAPTAAESLKQRFTPATRLVALAVGPEGGWSDTDLRLFAGLGFVDANLGPRILRTETAGLAALAALQVLGGDF